MRHFAMFDGFVDLTSTATLTPGNGISVSGNTITVTPTFTPHGISESYLTFSDGAGHETVVNVDIFT